MVDCKNCKYYVDDEGMKIGMCRRYPPRFHSMDNTDRFALVEELDWCGEFKKKSR